MIRRMATLQSCTLMLRRTLPLQEPSNRSSSRVRLQEPSNRSSSRVRAYPIVAATITGQTIFDVARSDPLSAQMTLIYPPTCTCIADIRWIPADARAMFTHHPIHFCFCFVKSLSKPITDRHSRLQTIKRRTLTLRQNVRLQMQVPSHPIMIANSSFPPARTLLESFLRGALAGTNGGQRSLLLCTLLLSVVPSSAGFFVSGCSSAMRRRDAEDSGARMDAWRSEFWCPLSPSSRQIQTTFFKFACLSFQSKLGITLSQDSAQWRQVPD